MLARGTKSVYVCLRCQANPLGDSLRPLRVTNALPYHVLRRWQSAATRRVVLDEADYEHGNNGTAGDGSHHSQSQDENPPRPRRRQQFWGNWKPKPTAELGVDSLGKPAEVLLL